MGAPLAVSTGPAGEPLPGIPYDLSFPPVTLTGTPGRADRVTLEVDTVGPFVARSVGYGVVPRPDALRFGLSRVDEAPLDEGIPARLSRFATNPGSLANLFAAGAPQPDGLPLRAITFGDVLDSALEAIRASDTRVRNRLAEGLLRHGIRLAPEFATAAVSNPNMPLEPRVLSNLFEVVPDPGRLQFLYGLFDEGSGREFQNQLILSTAGLGKADGTRPFRSFDPPIRLEPRTIVRLEVREVSDLEGELYMTLHGLRLLSAPTDTREAERRRALVHRGRRRR